MRAGEKLSSYGGPTISAVDELRRNWGIGRPPSALGDEIRAQIVNTVIVPTLCPDQLELLQSAQDPEYVRPPAREVRDGHYLVGAEIQAGTYTIDGKTVDCYWERSDNQGNIIENNFVSVAASVTVSIAETDAGFTSQGCGLWSLVE